jgi:malate dehydrogenase (oxaloacetate-decarboxylating)
MGGQQAWGSDGGADRFAADPAFAVHEGGKLRVQPTRSIGSIADLALTYTPGVARVSRAIAAEPGLGRRFTWAWATSARPPRCR